MGHFGNARISAQRTPDPLDSEHWSIDMLNIAERIRSAGVLLGGPTPWDDVVWSSWPFYPLVEGVPLPGEAWEWLDGWLEWEGQKEQWAGWNTSALFALQYRPV